MTLATRLSELITAIAADIKALATAISGKQATLVSGQNIKTINGDSILGTGNIAISGGSSGVSAGKAIAMSIVFGG